MSDDPRYRTPDRYGDRERDFAFHDLVEHSVRRLVTGLVIAGGLIGLGLYMSAPEEPPTYQVTTTSDGRIIRVNTDSGTVIACDGGHCGIVLERGQDLEDDPPARADLPKQQAQPALPAPAAAPDNAAAPAG